MYIAELSTVTELEWEDAKADYRAAVSAWEAAVDRAVNAIDPHTWGDLDPIFRNVLLPDAPAWAVAADAVLAASSDVMPTPNLHYVRYSHTATPAATVRKAAATYRNWTRKLDRALTGAPK